MMAEAYRKAGQPEEGIAVLDEGLDCVERTGERFYEAEISSAQRRVADDAKNG